MGIVNTGSALGMIVARFVKNEETASMAANAITFPMMFLSGTFFQLEMMPSYLQQIAAVLPLTYMSQGLRDAMVYDNLGGAYFNLAVVAVIGAILVVALEVGDATPLLTALVSISSAAIGALAGLLSPMGFRR